MKIETEQACNRLRTLRLDKYTVDQGLMLNCIVGALTGMVAWQSVDGKINANDIVDVIERIHEKYKVVN